MTLPNVVKGGPPLLLVVDDDLDIRRDLHESLEAEGFRVSSAWNGVDALHYLQTNPIKPAAILLDLVMPVMGGETFVAHLRANPALAGIPVVVVSVREKPPIPVAGYLRKPFDLNELIAVIRRVVSPPVRAVPDP